MRLGWYLSTICVVFVAIVLLQIPPSCDVNEWLGDEAVPGLYVLCGARGTTIVYRSRTDSEMFQLKDPSLPASTRYFSEDGERSGVPAWSVLSTVSLGFTGGAWVWPGVAVGHKRSIPVPGPNAVTLTTLSLRPLIFSATHAMGKQHVTVLKAEATKLMKRSQVEDVDFAAWRTSNTAWLPRDLDSSFGKRIAQVTRVPQSHQEDTQVLQYHPGTKYGMHIDYFDDEQLHAKRHNRLLTLLLYLNNLGPDEGGWTVFPAANGTLPDRLLDVRDPATCKQWQREWGALLMQPQVDTSVLFYNLLPDGTPDDFSVHAACPTVAGAKKFAANKWVWNVPQT
eukprot:NODE_1889_length_1190_cov_62.333020_g1873_i0.p1 GENE.NODE_1889_length_1190_cov_62.333020_g1873_i0~~NODE_1889_length_1190_cov_62.333020_g1873_i0.p1  ORF type:complete len:338 (+),score=18.68 NODE_1889_length_1190_cov_62.333020_g1873_i0:87-1100(+)